MEIKLGPLTISQDRPPIFIVELGINHNGNMDLAIDLVEAARSTGAQVVKFQHHLPHEEMMEGHPLWNIIDKTKLSIDQLLALKNHAESLGLVFLCTPFSFKAADELNAINVAGFKMGSGELNNIPLQRHVARKGKPMIVSTGMSSLREVHRTINLIQLSDDVHSVHRRVILMNCCSTYPATPRQSRLNRLDALRQINNGLVGQSDHTPTISTCLGAIAKGAVVIEKHMTLDRGMEGPDHAASILPSEFKQMVEMGNEIWQAKVGYSTGLEGGNDVLQEERKVREWANHSLVTTCAIRAGIPILGMDITTKRPGDGIPSSKWDEVVGKRATRYLPENHKLEEGDYA